MKVQSGLRTTGILILRGRAAIDEESGLNELYALDTKSPSVLLPPARDCTIVMVFYCFLADYRGFLVMLLMESLRNLLRGDIRMLEETR